MTVGAGVVMMFSTASPSAAASFYLPLHAGAVLSEAFAAWKRLAAAVSNPKEMEEALYLGRQVRHDILEKNILSLLLYAQSIFLRPQVCSLAEAAAEASAPFLLLLYVNFLGLGVLFSYEALATVFTMNRQSALFLCDAFTIFSACFFASMMVLSASMNGLSDSRDEAAAAAEEAAVGAFSGLGGDRERLLFSLSSLLRRMGGVRMSPYNLFEASTPACWPPWPP